MKDPKFIIPLIIPLIGLLVTTAGFAWKVRHDIKKSPMVVVTKDGAPAPDVELIANDGAQFSIDPKTGLAHVTDGYIGTLVIVRQSQSRKELGRFTLKAGWNEVSLQ